MPTETTTQLEQTSKLCSSRREKNEKTGAESFSEYVDWLQNVWLPNVGQGLKFPERPRQQQPRLTLIQGGRDDRLTFLSGNRERPCKRAFLVHTAATRR